MLLSIFSLGSILDMYSPAKEKEGEKNVYLERERHTTITYVLCQGDFFLKIEIALRKIVWNEFGSVTAWPELAKFPNAESLLDVVSYFDLIFFPIRVGDAFGRAFFYRKQLSSCLRRYCVGERNKMYTLIHSCLQTRSNDFKQQ